MEIKLKIAVWRIFRWKPLDWMIWHARLGSTLSKISGSDVCSYPGFRAEKRKKHARTLRERGAPKVSKMAVILIFLFSTIYYATADIPVSSDNFPTQEDSCRYSLAVVRFSYCLLNVKKDFKALDVPAACKQIASTSLLLLWTFLEKATI